MRRPCWIFLLTLAALLAGCSKQPRPAAPAGLQRVVLQTDWFPEGEHGGFYQALAKGYYREAGLDVEILPGGPGTHIKLMVAKGDADFGMMRSDDAIVAAGRGLPLVMVMADLQHDPQALLVHANSPVITLPDLNGRTVIAAPSMAWIPYVQGKYHIKFDLRPVTYGLGGFFADPDAIQQCLVTNEPFFARQHGVAVRTVPLSDSGYDSYHAIICRRELIRINPNLVRAFVTASIRGWQDYLDGDPGPANELILRRNPQMSAELLNYTHGELILRALVTGNPAKDEGIGRLSFDRLGREVGILSELKILETPIAVHSVATKEFLPVSDQ